MKKLIILVGVPGSGKTTLASKIAERGYDCLNADSIRQELWGNPADQREPERVFAIFFKKLEELLAQGRDIIIDNTNINQKQRRPIIERAANAGYTDIQLWLLDVPLDLCLERNRNRDRAVPEDIVANMFMTLNRHGRPRKEEGKLVLIRPGKGDEDYRIFYPQQ